MMKWNQGRGAFGLVELLVVTALLGVLAYLLLPVVSQTRMTAKRAQCAHQMRQIGKALFLYAADHGGNLPVTSHTTGNSRRKVDGEWVYNIEKSWIYTVAPYLSDVEAVRICPADEEERQERIREIRGTSYLLNDLIFDDEAYQKLALLPRPASTQMVFISNRSISRTWDHAHCGDWSNWAAVNEDVATDRHRTGRRDPDYLSGSANYLYADGHVEQLTSRAMKQIVESGAAPWNPESNH